jgi:hypothetical protein
MHAANPALIILLELITEISISRDLQTSLLHLTTQTDRTSKEIIVVYFKVLSQHVPKENSVNHKNLYDSRYPG